MHLKSTNDIKTWTSLDVFQKKKMQDCLILKKVDSHFPKDDFDTCIPNL